MGVFQPRFIQQNELASFNLPTSGCDTGDNSIMSLVDLASTTIDEHCGRTDGDGNGSLAYTTYQERLTDQSAGRGIFLLPKRPLAAVPLQTVQELSGADINASGYYYTGCLPNTVIDVNGSLSCLISISGRYIEGRRDRLSSGYSSGLGYGYNTDANPFEELSLLYGGIPPWQPIDIRNVSYDISTGELWIGRDFLMSNFSEVIVTYNSGFDPRKYPRQLKLACAAIVRNMLPRGGNTGMTSFSSSRSGVSAQFDPNLIDPNIKSILASFVSIRTT